MKRLAGFTLVELLLALAITAVLVILLANVVSATLGVWQQGRSRLDTFSDARQLIGRLTDEMSAAVASPGGIQFVENDPALGGTAALPGSSENVFFIAPYPNGGTGDLCVISYRRNSAAHTLERRFKDSSAAWNVGAGATGRFQAGSYPDANPTEWRTIANGVIEFEVRSFSQTDLDTNAMPEDTWDSATANPAMAGKTPRRILLRLKVVDDRTIARLGSLSPEAITRAAREFYADLNLPAR